LNPPPITNDLLALRAMPEVAAALRQRADAIMQRWTAEVERHLPDADPLTLKQVRNSIPTVLEKIALALESASVDAVMVLQEVGTAHGVARFQQRYNIEEVIIEYRLLRRVLFEELYRAAGFKLTFADAIPVDMSVDTSLHRGVSMYVRELMEELQSAARTEAKFLAYLSHDLRNNLATVTLRLKLLANALGNEPRFAEEVANLNALEAAVHQTMAGMERLLQAERLRRQNVETRLMPVNLHRLAGELIAAVQRDAQQKHLHIENAVPPDAAAHSDRELLTLTLQNLLGNAIKFSSAGTIRIKAETHELGWKVSVSDQGPGIAPEQTAALFNAFTRGESHGQAGMGLGLSIASHAARMLGTELTVQSTLGQGTTFTLKLPPADPQAAR
jgi:signal transduction histidine kinase